MLGATAVSTITRRSIYIALGGVPASALAAVAVLGFLPGVLFAQDFAIVAALSVIGARAGWRVILQPAAIGRRWLAALAIVFGGLVPLSFVILMLDGAPLLQVLLVIPGLVACALLFELWRQPDRQSRDLWRFLAGLVVGLVCTFILFSGRYDNAFVNTFAAELRSSDRPVDLRRHTDFAWDRVYVLLPYGSAWDDWMMLGYPWLKFSLIQPKFDERDVGWVFVKNGLVTRYASVSWRELPFPNAAQFDSSNAKFRIAKTPWTDREGQVHTFENLSAVQSNETTEH